MNPAIFLDGFSAQLHEQISMIITDSYRSMITPVWIGLGTITCESRQMNDRKQRITILQLVNSYPIASDFCSEILLLWLLDLVLQPFETPDKTSG